MGKSNSIFIGMLFIGVLISVSQCGIIDRYLNTKFFKKLSATEQRAIISLAIAYHDAPENSNQTSVFPTNPIRPTAEEIPATVFGALMNGEVPREWMKKFIDWLVKEKRITVVSLNQYRRASSDVLCQADNVTCYSISDVGQNCCPFG